MSAVAAATGRTAAELVELRDLWCRKCQEINRDNMKQMSTGCTHTNTSNECMRDRKRECERKREKGESVRESKSGKRWQKLTAKVSYLCVACATKGDYTKKPAAAKKLAAASGPAKIAQDVKVEADTPPIFAIFDAKIAQDVKAEADTPG